MSSGYKVTIINDYLAAYVSGEGVTASEAYNKAMAQLCDRLTKDLEAAKMVEAKKAKELPL